MSHPRAVRVLCSASGDGAAPPGLLILRVSAFPPPDPEGEREGGLGRAEPGPVSGRHRLEANSAPTEGKDFPGMGKSSSREGVVGAGEVWDPKEEGTLHAPGTPRFGLLRDSRGSQQPLPPAPPQSRL